jgi:hypothetical protein
MRRSWTPSIVPTGHDRTVYLVLDDFGRLGRCYPETDPERADLETVVSDLLSGQFNNPLRIVAFNVAERWAEDASEDIAREIVRRFDLAGDELPLSLEGFVEQHLGPERQLTLRLARWVHKNKPLPVLADRGDMCMRNGKRCYARWLLKDHACGREPKAQNHSRRYCRQGGVSFVVHPSGAVLFA